MDNQTIKTILTRSSVRIYEDRNPLPDNVVETILRCAMAAPSAVNKQPWSFVVIKDTSILDSLASALPYAKMTAHAPLAIVVCGDKNKFLDGGDSTLWIQDLAAVSENILLAAHALGYGGVWTCVYPHIERMDPVASILGLPDNIVPFNLIPIGKPKGHGHIMDKWQPDCIHEDKWLPD